MLFFPQLSALVVVLVASCSILTNAHSPPARPLKRLAHPSTLALDIVPRQTISSSEFHKRSIPHPDTLRHDDSFRLIITAFSNSYHIHLRPNDHLIHPAARINYYSLTSDGRSVITSSKPLLRESVKAYLGEVVAGYHSATRLREDAARYFPQDHPAVLGWARIMVHHQGDSTRNVLPRFEGAFSADGVIHHIMTKDNYLRMKHPLDPDVSQPLDDSDDSLVIWRDSDVMTPEEERIAITRSASAERPSMPQTCGHDRLEFNIPSQNPILKETPTWFSHPIGPWSNQSLHRRDDVGAGSASMGSNFIDNIGQTVGCPTSQKVLYMGVAADCTYVSMYGSQENATTQILNNWNGASALYKNTFNVSLGIVELQVQGPQCPTTVDNSIPWNIPCSGAELDSRLSLFSQWRGNKGNDSTGLWHLMSGCPTGSEVGIAWLGTLCQQEASGNSPTIVSGTAVSTSGRTEWQVVAHEIGHNFGAIHDCADGCTTSDGCCPLTSTTCDANARFIMSPVAQAGETVFSPCSVGNICSVMQSTTDRVDTSCLVDPDPNRAIISLQMCGNGIVEKGEDCDPGGASSSCCDATTCKFKSGALCDPASSPCCQASCTFAPATQVCRASKDASCDQAEMCTGNSSSCPPDAFSPNGQSCGSNDLKCASGLCTSVAKQCQSVGGSMNLTAACPNRGDETCQISCQDPTQANQCVLLTTLLIDGSPCGFGGTCASGKCQSASFLDTAKAWYLQNLQISIPVTIVAGLVALLLIWALYRGIRRCCTRNRRTVPGTTMIPVIGHTHERLASFDQRGYSTGQQPFISSGSGALYTAIPPAAHDRTPSYGGGNWDGNYNYSANNRGNWVDDSVYNGSGQRRH